MQDKLEQIGMSLTSLMQQQVRLQIYDAFERLQKSDCYKNPKSLIPFGRKIYSQNEEDGIICEIFKRIGTTNKLFIEFGVESGLENNTLALLFDGWKGLWIDGNPEHVNRIRNNMPKTINSGRLSVMNAFITRDNINDLINSVIANDEIDLLSIDLDGNDYPIFESIHCIAPRVVVIEYNAKFPPPIQYCMEYTPNHRWDGTDNFGISLKSLEIKMGKKDYLLVCCNLTGSNAFFVRKDLTANKFLEPFTAEVHYEPARYHLVGLSSGHRPSYSTLENSFSS